MASEWGGGVQGDNGEDGHALREGGGPSHIAWRIDKCTRYVCMGKRQCYAVKGALTQTHI